MPFADRPSMSRRYTAQRGQTTVSAAMSPAAAAEEAKRCERLPQRLFDRAYGRFQSRMNASRYGPQCRLGPGSRPGRRTENREGRFGANRKINARIFRPPEKADSRVADHTNDLAGYPSSASWIVFPSASSAGQMRDAAPSLTMATVAFVLVSAP